MYALHQNRGDDPIGLSGLDYMPRAVSVFGLLNSTSKNYYAVIIIYIKGLIHIIVNTLFA